ncbi:glycosyltransferase family 4 protein [Glycomyces sp. MUSA5-2]|uniref:glycosyltransferase family 4 protein n=1 Tax=Glycomyces sp. MUSA5-2 TaxID=2053002 RepID=UPI00300A8A47
MNPTTTDARPEPGAARVVMVVPNRIEGDSRVQKAAASMAEAGWDVHLVGVSVTGEEQHYGQDGYSVHKVPLPKLAPPPSLRRRVAFFRYPFAYGTPDRARQRRHRIKIERIELEARRQERAGTGGRDGLLRPPLPLSRIGRRVQRAWIGRRLAQSKARDRFVKREGRLERWEIRWWTMLLGDRAWRRLDIAFHRFELAFRPEILRLEPDLIHVHDAFPLGIAARVSDRMRAEGKRVRILYDAHEYVPGHSDGIPLPRQVALTRYERRYLPYADAVVTVSGPLAKLLQADHGLDREPSVVLNAPLGAGPARPDPGDVRSDCKLDEDTPLAVYSGWAAPERQIDVMIEAARLVPGLHLAFLISKVRMESPYGKSLVALGEELGVADRLHFRDYVHYADLPRFLSTADMGIHPMRTGSVNHEIALPNKFFEYSHARLPLVVSNVKTMAAEVRRLGNGEVFTSGDPASMAEAIRRILADKQSYRRAYEDPALLEEYSWERQARKYTELYEELIGPAPKH